MIQDGEDILYVSEAEVIAYSKIDNTKTVKNAGFVCKKIVVTTRRFLIFQDLKNRIQETEYELISTVAKKTIKPPTENTQKPRITINGYPELWLQVAGLESKVVIQEDPAIYKFLQKQGIQNLVKSVVGAVILKQPKKMKFYILAMGGISNAIRFAKSLICAQGWQKYSSFCNSIKTDVNRIWIRILVQIIHNDDSVVLIDPDLFDTGTQQQINSFIALITVIPFAHCFHHRYSITTPEAAAYTTQFISSIQSKVHSLSFTDTHVSNPNLSRVLLKLTLANLLRLDISQNNLEDDVLQTLSRLIKAGSKRLTYINLSKNNIKLANSQLLVELFKIVTTILNLNLSHNLIDDSSTQTFEKYVIFAFNPPLEQLNLSHNKFSRKIAWRLYVGNVRNFKTHPYLRLILFPVPLKPEIFGENNVDFPRHNTTINLNMHSALIQQFQQESLLKHTFEQQVVTAKEIVTIRFQRVLAVNVKLPMNKQELNRTLQISHKIQNFIKIPQSVQRICDMALQLKNFPFEVPPISRTHFIKFLDSKFNEALFIRDHYSVKYLLKALNQLAVSVDGYADRLQRLRQRDRIYAKRAEVILNFQIDESKINDELDQLVREGLRLYLEGHGIQIIYYLKYKRDQYIEKYLHEKLNPEHYLFQLQAKRNISDDKRISQQKFVVPYEIRLQKKINENFYLHAWQANYQILSEMKTATFDDCLAFLEQSEKKEKFTIYFERIEERIEFIKNQFTSFEYKRFKASYSDLKINSCRLIYLYNNIENTLIFLEIPIYVKKRLITPEKTISILNKDWFKREYHMVNYPNIRIEARRANIYNYRGIICRYESEMFKTEVVKIFPSLYSLLDKMQECCIKQLSMNKIAFRILEDFKALIKIVRNSLVPEQIKQELYLHLITWRKGRFSNNTEMLHLLTTFTMYLKPPLQIEKYMVAAILQNQNIDLADVPMCLATNPNQPTSDTVLMDNDFVERDWIPTDPVFVELLEKKGKVTITLELLQKTRIVLTVSESKTVAELMDLVVDCIQMKSEDKQHFWLYKLHNETQEIIAYESREHIGQIMVDLDKQSHKLLLKRRIYSRQLKYNYSRYSENLIDSLYHDIKYEYIARNFFVNDKTAVDIAALLFVIQCVQRYMMEAESVVSAPRTHQKLAEKKTIEEYIYDQTVQIESTFQAFLPRPIYMRLLKSKQSLVAQLKAKISERALKKQHNTIHEMKLSLIKMFSRFPQFMSSNYRVQSIQKHQMCVFINAMFISIESRQENECIHFQKLVSIVPKPKYLLLYYHKQENLMAQLHLVAPEKIILSMVMDILAYCSLRMKMSSINLYEIHRLEELEKNIIMHEQSLKRVYSKNTENDLLKCRQDVQQTARKVAKVSLTLMNFKELQYYNKNRYFKSEINRKLYANKSDRKLDFDREMDEEQISEMLVVNKKILQVTFPYHIEQEKEEPTNRKSPADQSVSIDYNNQYERLNLYTGLKEQDKKEQEIKSKLQPQGLYQPKSNFESPYSKKQMPPLKPIQADNQDQDEVVTNKKAKRGGSKKPARRGDL